MNEKRKTIKLILSNVKGYKTDTALSIVFIVLEAVCECIIPFIMSKLLNALSNYALSGLNFDLMINDLILFGCILLILAITSFCGGVFAGRFSAKAGCGFAKNLRESIFIKTTKFSFTNIDKFSSSSLITRQTFDVSNIQQSFIMLTRIGVRSPIIFIFSFVMSIIIAPSFAPIILAIIIPLVVIPAAIIIKICTKRFMVLFDLYDEINEKVEENVRGIRVVKTYAREDYEKEKFEKESLKMAKGFRVVEQLLSATNPIIQTIMYISICIILFVGTTIIINSSDYDAINDVITFHSLKIGDVSSLITYCAQVLSSLMMLSMILFFLIMALPSIKRVGEVLIEEPTIKVNENAIKDIKNGDIEFKNVNFKYDLNASKYALKDVNFKINSGETIGIIGGTGSSKTTLVNLISRFYDTTSGEVLVGDVNVKDYDLVALRDSISVVLQKNVLFSGTIEENLKWGNKEATIEEINHVCDIAQCTPFINQFKDGLNHKIDQGGTNVSGGQRQRLCIARALLKNPKVLILDDSTSAVDTKTDAFIRKGLKEYLPSVTKIIIAQRINSVSDADRIIVMDKGMIVGIGTHEELLKTNSIYQEVYAIQSKIGGAK